MAKWQMLAIAMNDVLMTPGHHFQIRVVFNSVTLLYREMGAKV